MSKSFKLDKKGVRELMQSEEMTNVLQDYANEIKLGAGEGYITKRIKTRMLVGTEDPKKVQDNLDNNTLLKATHKHRKSKK